MAQVDTDSKTSYFNTIVFAVVSGVLSLVLLALLLHSEIARNYAPFIVTLELGVLSVLLFAVYRIRTNEQRSRKRAINVSNNLLSIDTCPDYWTRDGNKCLNVFDQGNGGARFRLVNTPSSINLSDYNNKPLGEACKKMAAQVQAPWTDMRALCGSSALV